MSITLDVPFKSQLDNFENPYGACNVTSIAMCLAYFGAKSKNPKIQLEDELYHYMEQKGLSRHSPYDLATVVRNYGYRDNYTSAGNIEMARDHLAAGAPCVIHGWFTDSGHIIVLKGFDDKGFRVHDPYGEYWESGYDTAASGANLHYSYKLIRETCMQDGYLWLHRISA